MILNLNETKNYLRVDFNDDDTFIQMLIDMSEQYLNVAANNVFDSNNKLAKLFCLALISDLYDNRGYTIENASDKVRYILNSILMQLTFGGA